MGMYIENELSPIEKTLLPSLEKIAKKYKFSLEPQYNIRESNECRWVDKKIAEGSYKEDLRIWAKDNDVPFYYSYTKYVLDFAFFRDKIKIDVECDGEEWHSSGKNYSRRGTYEHERDRDIFEKGWSIIRIRGKDIYNNLKEVEKELDTFFHSMLLREHFSQFGKVDNFKHLWICGVA